MRQFDDTDIMVRGHSREQVIHKVNEGYLEDLELLWANEISEKQIEEWYHSGEFLIVISESSPVWEDLVDELTTRLAEVE